MHEYLDPRLLQDPRYAIHRRNCSTFSKCGINYFGSSKSINDMKEESDKEKYLLDFANDMVDKVTNKCLIICSYYQSTMVALLYFHTTL